MITESVIPQSAIQEENSSLQTVCRCSRLHQKYIVRPNREQNASLQKSFKVVVDSFLCFDSSEAYSKTNSVSIVSLPQTVQHCANA